MNQDERKKFWDVLLTMHDAAPEHLQQLQKTIIVPNTLCRFRAVNENSLAQLQENKLYFSTADYYDDPFDTYFYVNYRPFGHPPATFCPLRRRRRKSCWAEVLSCCSEEVL